MKKNNQTLNANLSLKKVSKNGKDYENIIVTISGFTFEVAPKFLNRKQLYKVKCLIKEVSHNE